MFEYDIACLLPIEPFPETKSSGSNSSVDAWASVEHLTISCCGPQGFGDFHNLRQSPGVLKLTFLSRRSTVRFWVLGCFFCSRFWKIDAGSERASMDIYMLNVCLQIICILMFQAGILGMYM